MALNFPNNPTINDIYGAEGKLFICKGVNPAVWPFHNTGGGAGGGPVLLQTAVANTTQYLTLTSFDHSLYSRYEVVLKNVVTTSSNAWFYLRTSSDGGATYDFGSSDYMYHCDYRENDGIGGHSSGTSGINLTRSQSSVVSGGGANGSLMFYLADDPTTPTHLVGAISAMRSNSSHNIHFRIAAQRKELAIVNGLEFSFDNANILQGTFELWGLT